MRTFLFRWLATTIAVAVATGLTGMRADSVGALAVAAFLLGVINASIRPALLFLSLPLIVLSLGIFVPVLNALLLWMVGGLVPGFRVDGFWQAFFGGIVVSVVSWFVGIFFGPVSRGGGGGTRVVIQHVRGMEGLDPADPELDYRGSGEPKPVQGRVIK